MLTKIEGLVLTKVPFKDRHIISHLLLRNGRKVSVVFYGGQGGGKKQKPSIIELGRMLKIELARGTGKTKEEIYTAKEYSSIWQAQKIRENHNAYYLLCFFLELIEKIAQEEDLKSNYTMEDESSKELFAVISNAIFQLEQSLKENNFDQPLMITFFLLKLMIALGIYPDIKSCCLCGEAVAIHERRYQLAPQHGGFVCANCDNDSSRFSETGAELLAIFSQVPLLKYSELVKLSGSSLHHFQPLLNYLCYQFGLNKESLKTVSYLEKM